MRFIVLMVFALITPTSAFAVPSVANQEPWREHQQILLQEQSDSRKFLYDQITLDIITDGHVSDVLQACLDEMRYRRSDGSTVVRLVGLCEESIQGGSQ